MHRGNLISYAIGKSSRLLFCLVVGSYFVTASAQQSPIGGQANPAMRPPAGGLMPNVPPPSDLNRGATPSGASGTSQMLPQGAYTLEITVAGKTASHHVTVGRNGDNVAVALPNNEGVLNGVLNPKGYLRVDSAAGSERLTLTGLMQDPRTVSGNTTIVQGAKSLTGSFKLSPAMAVRAKQLQKFEDTGKGGGAAPCGFWCTIKGWFTL